MGIQGVEWTGPACGERELWIDALCECAESSKEWNTESGWTDAYRLGLGIGEPCEHEWLL